MSRRGWAAALAVLVLTGPMLGYVHVLSVQHARCPEHGELLHVESGVPGVAPAEALVPAGESRAGARSDPARESHDHDHCLVTSARKIQAATMTAGAALPLVAPRSPLPAQQDALAEPPIALYVLAPKNSPPA
jgi:hypothetical protein